MAHLLNATLFDLEICEAVLVVVSFYGRGNWDPVIATGSCYAGTWTPVWFQSLRTFCCTSHPAWSWWPPAVGLLVLDTSCPTAFLFWHTLPPKDLWSASEGLKTFFLFSLIGRKTVNLSVCNTKSKSCGKVFLPTISLYFESELIILKKASRTLW